MKGKETDILNSLNLKNMPYSVPEGYFEKFRSEVRKEARPRRSIWNRFAPYAGLAASFAAIFAIGTTVLERTTDEFELSQEDYMLFADGASLSAIYDMADESQFAEASINEEDIIEYLIYSGITAEEVEQYK